MLAPLKATRLVYPGLAALGCLLFNGAALGAENLLRNATFEATAAGRPAEWQSPPGAGVKHVMEAAAGRTGRALRLQVSVYDRIDRTSRAAIEQRGIGPLRSQQWYRLSGWTQAINLRSGLLRSILVDERAGENAGLYLELPVRGEWTRFEKTFQMTGRADAQPRLEFFFEETGEVRFDDLELVEVPAPQAGFTDLVPKGPTANLVPNASFEGGTANWTSLGRPTAWVGGLSSLFGEIDDTKAWHGRQSLRIALNRATLPISHFDVWPPARVVQDAPLAASLGWLPVPRGGPVTLSAYLCADRAGVPARLTLHFATPGGAEATKEQRVELTTEWKRYEFTCPAEAGAVFVAVGPDLGGAKLDEAVVWLDGVQLEAGARASAFVAREPLAIALTSVEFGDVFGGPNVPRLRVSAVNEGAARELNLSLRARDYFGRELPAQAVKFAVPAAGAAARDIDLALPGRGYYSIELFDADRAGSPSLLLRPLVLAWIEEYRGLDSPFGINHVPSTAELSRQMRRAGLTWGRDWSINWEQLEPVEGKLDFTAADVQIDRTRREGLQPLALLPPFPSANWASSIPPEALKESPEWAKLWIEAAYPPRDPLKLEAFMRKAAQHFKTRVQVWEFLNEPFYTLHALPALDQIDESLKGLAGANYKVQDYVELLKRAYRVTKEVSPDSRLIGGIGGRPDLLSRDFFRAGGLQHLDIFNLHIYPGLRKPEYYIGEMERLLAWMDESGGRKPVWITEYGYYGLETPPWEPYVLSAWEWAGNRLLKDEREASDFSLRFAVIMLAHGVEKIFYHSGMGVSGNLNSHAANESWMTGYGGAPRKLYAAQAALAKFLGERPVFAAAVQPAAAGGVLGYAFDTPGRSVAVVWAPDKATRVQIAPGVTAWDVMGNPLKGGTVTLDGSPCYLTSQTLTAKQLAQAWQQR